MQKFSPLPSHLCMEKTEELCCLPCCVKFQDDTASTSSKENNDFDPTTQKVAAITVLHAALLTQPANPFNGDSTANSRPLLVKVATLDPCISLSQPLEEPPSPINLAEYECTIPRNNVSRKDYAIDPFSNDSSDMDIPLSQLKINRVIKNKKKSRPIVDLWGLYLKLESRKKANCRAKAFNEPICATDSEISRMNQKHHCKLAVPPFSPHKEATLTLQLGKDLGLTFNEDNGVIYRIIG
ncbi:hypothetical protein GH714_013028 [Hevea brasiliensis]|uniref:Uncharacterized protein n=1 Tax=Hevea brasiliensis TaxID=3981 RepID=A0A6A6LRI2_HEVBR|nr:hypothetical protein GH714_013028 [Hevea brasiliensis]